MTAEASRPLTGERLRTPRVAAYAGIVFAVLMTVSMVLFQLSIPLSEPYESKWLDDSDIRFRVSVAVALVPFAGIAFLWLIGVIRDRIGDQEDQFFGTVFLGSGLLFLGGLFVWAAVVATVLSAAASAPGTWTESGSFVFGMSLIENLGGTITLRMAGVFMFSSGTIWLRTRALPRWVVWTTYVLSIVLLFGGLAVQSLRLVFPLWVLLVSISILRVSSGRLADDSD
jgi:hypothetical protein